MAQHEVLAPMPGTFYRRPNPAAPPFVEEGQRVGPDDTVCLVEIMKQFTEIKAGAAGTVVKFLVENEDVVMPGQAVATITLD